MKHLVVVAHPIPHSFTMALADAYAAELGRLGHEVRTRDLYRIGFQPVLAPAELGQHGAGRTVGPEVLEEQEHIRWADALTVVYPLWWLSMPAILKGYVDRVFSEGFAYGAESGSVRGLISNKTVVLITLSASPLSGLMGAGDWSAVEALQDGHVFRSVGFKVLEHLHLGEVRPGLPADLADQYAKRVRACARWYFPVERQIADA